MTDRASLLLLLRRWPETTLVVGLLFLLCVTGGIALEHDRQVEPIRIVAGEVPPQMDQSGRGREAEIIRAALRQTYGGRQIEFHVVPFTRHWEAFKNDEKYDGVATVPLKLDLGGFSSGPYIEYQNGIVYRRSDFPQGLGPDPVLTLRGKRVVAFAGAAGILPQVGGGIRNFEYYAEYADQYIHSAMLAQNFVDVVISDRLIFDTYDRKVLGAQYQKTAPTLVFDPAFCPTPYRIVFRTDEMRNAFNHGLSVIRQSGELDRINARYQQGAGISEIARSGAECG
jgi:polar amino acid transport system substrate-binding protein